MLCERCNKNEMFDTKGVPVNIEVRGVRRVAFENPRLCVKCIGEIWEAEDQRARQSLPPDNYSWPRS